MPHQRFQRFDFLRIYGSHGNRSHFSLTADNYFDHGYVEAPAGLKNMLYIVVYRVGNEQLHKKCPLELYIVLK